MFILILRSICVGVAFLVVSVFLGGFALAFWASRSEPPPEHGGQLEIGWDLVTLYHNTSILIKLLPLGFFLVGFVVGYRYFSRALPGS